MYADRSGLKRSCVENISKRAKCPTNLGIDFFFSFESTKLWLKPFKAIFQKVKYLGSRVTIPRGPRQKGTSWNVIRRRPGLGPTVSCSATGDTAVGQRITEYRTQTRADPRRVVLGESRIPQSARTTATITVPKPVREGRHSKQEQPQHVIQTFTKIPQVERGGEQQKKMGAKGKVYMGNSSKAMEVSFFSFLEP